jgi:hypothetical protein
MKFNIPKEIITEYKTTLGKTIEEKIYEGQSTFVLRSNLDGGIFLIIADTTNHYMIIVDTENDETDSAEIDGAWLDYYFNEKAIDEILHNYEIEFNIKRK